MGLHDRKYWGEGRGEGDPGTGGGGMLLGGMFPRPGKAVKWVLLLTLAAFVAQAIVGRFWPVEAWFGVTAGAWWQVWRYITFQFLHSPTNILHIALNMLMVYMLGTRLEQLWGTRKFLKFYLSCGVTAGVLYAVIAAVVASSGSLAIGWDTPIIGASGGVYGIILAVAVLLPQMRILFLFFPIPIRVFALIVFGGMLLINLPAGPESNVFWSEIAHLGGTLAAVVWIWAVPRVGGVAAAQQERIRQGAWERKMRQRQEEQAQIDRILEKIHVEGLNSLTGREKRILQDATRRQQEQEKHFRQQR